MAFSLWVLWWNHSRPSAEGVVPSLFGCALEVAVVHGHAQVMALVRECAGDLAEARESLRP